MGWRAFQPEPWPLGFSLMLHRNGGEYCDGHCCLRFYEAQHHGNGWTGTNRYWKTFLMLSLGYRSRCPTKLIFKGKSLKEMEESLSSFGIKQGCKLMMIGKRNSPEEESELKKLKDIEKSVEQTAKKLEKVDGELTGLKNGFLAKDLQAEALGRLDQRVKVASEQFMKILEQVDSMVTQP
ncbi:BAG family molecular chaperone regulator 1 [Salvelinus sp. IW2-2015]|uniref:BAG family molecular chaperone regulator 1 n=1 Tax=Salvelinus sp. IW2-2015 TaxID=2691554 RepID=UPI0038D4B79F